MISRAAVQTAIEYEYRFTEYRFTEYRFTEYRFTEYEQDEIRCEARTMERSKGFDSFLGR
jgi:hypothetical protein